MASLGPARQADGTWAVVDPSGVAVSQVRYRAIDWVHDGFSVAYRADGDAVLLDSSGVEVRTGNIRFAWILAVRDGRATACTRDGEVGTVDLHGCFEPESADFEWGARLELSRVGRMLYERGYNVSIDGNLSWRLDEDSLLITPSGVHLGFLRPEDLVVTDANGKLIRGDRPPTSELRLHVELHRTRPDCRCVVHAHAPYAVAASLAGVDLHQTYITAAPIPTTAYARISSEQTAAVVRPYMEAYNWAILPRHGVVAWAQSAWDAFLRIEGLEHAAKVAMIARGCGPIEPLSPDKRIELLSLWGLEHLG